MSEIHKKIVVTGIGLVSPLGVGVAATWEGLKAGRSGIRAISRFETEGYESRIAGEVPGKDEANGFDPEQWIERRDTKKMDTFIQYGMCAAKQAVDAAGLTDLPQHIREKTAVIVGSGIGGLPEIERSRDVLVARGPSRISPFFIPAILTNLLAGQISIRFGFGGANVCPVTACATGAHAVGQAMHLIRRGESPIALAGGAEACVCPLAVAGFAAAKALSTRNDDPARASRPFDQSRDGFVIAEGASILVLEDAEHARARGAHIIAEVAGFGQTADAYHMTAPVETGAGVKRAMTQALADAGMEAEEIGYVNAHATSTPAGDAIESQAIESIFGPNILVSATKSMTGHALGAAGGLEAAICCLALQEGILPPTINLENLSPECTLDYIRDKARAVPVTAALSNSFGFGGTNAGLVFKKV